MPNGGSDCCGTCWFNRKNHGEAGFAYAKEAGPADCEIRDLEISRPFHTYCSNHPYRCPERDQIPIGPIFTSPLEGGREIWKHSPDMEEIRIHLLNLLARIEEKPKEEYPAGDYRGEVIVWQVGQWREQRAIRDLERIAKFDPRATTGEPLRRTRGPLVGVAERALRRIREGSGGEV